MTRAPLAAELSQMPPTPERRRAVYALWMTRTKTEVARLTGLSLGQVGADLRWCMTHDGKPRKGRGRADRPAPETETARVFVSADQRRRLLREYLGTSWHAEPFYLQVPRPSRRVVGVGDFHGQPDPQVVAELVRAQADVYVIGGDTMDSRYASAHAAMSKEERTRNRQEEARSEAAAVRAMFETLLQETRGRLDIMHGNHESWSFKRVSEVLPEWALQYYRTPLELVTDDLGPRVRLVRYEHTYRHPDGSRADVPGTEFLYRLGDVLFSHMNFTSTKTMQGVTRLYRDWFQEWWRPLGLEAVHLLVHFHVHSRCMVTASGGHMVLVEPGMGGVPGAEAYKFGYEGKWRPSVQGFVMFEQYQSGEDWHTDPASIQLVAPRMGVYGRAESEAA